MIVNFHMEKLTVSIKDKKDRNEIIRLTVGELQSTLAQRPGAQAIKSVVQLPLFLSVFPAAEAVSQINHLPPPPLRTQPWTAHFVILTISSEEYESNNKLG